MKLLIALLFFIFMHINAYTENLITGIIITMPVSPDPNTATWGTNSVFTIQATTSERYLKEAMNTSILVTIKKGDGKVCGSYTNLNAPASNFSRLTMIWSGKSAVSLMGQECNLPPGDYKLCVQFFLKGQMVSEEVCKTFIIKVPENITYQPPQAIAPADGTVINEADAKKPVTFRWIPVTPKPRDAVTYKLRIFEVKQGQTATAVVKNANPLHEKDIINQTQYVLSSLSQLNADKGSSLAWTVQALDPKGNPVGGNNGMSNICKIIVYNTGCMVIDTTQYTIDCHIVGGQLHYTVQNLILRNITQNNGTTGLSSNSMDNYIQPFSGSGFTIENVNPSGGSEINSGNQLIFSFDIIGATGSTASLMILANVPATSTGGGCIVQIPVVVDLPTCICDDCDSLNWIFNNPLLTTQTEYEPNSNNTLFINQGISVSPYQIIKFKAEIINFNWYTQFSDCKKCSMNAYDWGNLISGTLNSPGFIANGIPPAIPGGMVYPNSHELLWTAANTQPAPLSGTINFSLSLPTQTELTCCTDCFRFCIRYSVVFIKDDLCKTCSTIKCYEFTRQHHPVLQLLNVDNCGSPHPANKSVK